MKTYKELEREFIDAVRRELLEGLAQCTDEQQQKFKLINAKPRLPIGDVVAAIPKSNLSSMMALVKRTLSESWRQQ